MHFASHTVNGIRTAPSMKLTIALLLMIGAAYAARQVRPAYELAGNENPNEPEEGIILDDDGNFALRFVDADGTMIQEEGVMLTNPETGEEQVVVKAGTYTYRSPSGEPIKLVYDMTRPGDLALEE